MSFWKKLGQTALTTGIEGLVNGVVSAPFNRLSQHIAEQGSSRLMRQQAAINRNSFDYSLSQQSPSAMVTRLTQAGLNPALMYGNGVQGMSQQVHSASPTSLGIQKNLQLSHSPVEMAQLDNIDADTNKKNEETIALQTENLHREEGILLDLQNKRLDLVLKQSQSSLNDKQREKIAADISFIDQQIKESMQRVEESKERIQQIKADTRLTTAKAQREETKVRYEKDYENRFGKPSPFELTGTISGASTRAGSTIKTAVSRFFNRQEESYKDWRDQNTKDYIEKQIAYKKELQQKLDNGIISKRKFDRLTKKQKENLIRFGLLDKVY